VIAETLLALGQSLASVLETRGQGARVLEAVFFRADGQTRRIAIETGKAMRDAKVFARLFRERLDALSDPLDPGFGFDLIRLCAHRAQDVRAENAGLDSNAAGAEVDLLIDKLAVRFGAHRVLLFQPQDTHIPEAETVAVPAQHADISKAPWRPRCGPGEAPRRPLRLFAKPEPVDVPVEAPDGQPVRFRWRGAQHKVRWAEGPERIAMEWWRHQASMPTRDYFRVEDETGRRFWLYRDGIRERESLPPRWYMHGLFA
jgi:protein ImuB